MDTHAAKRAKLATAAAPAKETVKPLAKKTVAKKAVAKKTVAKKAAVKKAPAKRITKKAR
jgi:hypothetical protein